VRFYALTGLVATLALASGQTVEFPIGYYSYDEIARMMSTAHRRVECAPELKGRVVLLRLKPRDWRQMRRILENTLEIQFRPVGGGDDRWILMRPPELLKQERRLREALARDIEQRIQEDRRLARRIRYPDAPTEAILEALEAKRPPTPFADYPQVAQTARLITTEMITLFREAPFEELLATWREIRHFQKAYEQGLPPVPAQVQPASNDPNPPERQSHQTTHYQQKAVERFLERYSLRDFRLHPAIMQVARRHAQMERSEWEARYGKPWLEDYSHRLVLVAYTLSSLAYSAILGYMHEAIAEQLQPPPNILQVLEQGTVVRVYELDIDSELLALWLQDLHGAVVPQYEPTRIRIRVLMSAYWDGTSYSYNILLLQHDFTEVAWKQVGGSVFGALSQETLIRLLQTVAPARHRQLQDALQRHEAFLNEPVWSQSSVLAGNRGSTLYERLYHWAKHHDQELAVEVLSQKSVRDPWVMPWAFFLNTQAPLREAFLTSARYAQTLVDRYEGVWTLRNFAAFVYRGQRSPALAPRLHSNLKGTSGAWRQLYRKMAQGQGAGLPPQEDTWLILYILAQLPPAQQEQLLQTNRSSWETPVSVPLRSLPAHARKQLGELLTRWGMVKLAYTGDFPRFSVVGDPKFWYDLLSGRLPMEQLLDGLALERYRDGYRSYLRLVYSPPGYLKPQSIPLLSVELPREQLQAQASDK
jgi:hypothetical protein